MKNKIIFLLLIILITSCTSGNNDAQLEKDLYKGTQGVVLEYFKNNFPDEVFEEETLNYAVRITNKGPYEASNTILLVSLEKGYMNFKDGSSDLENVKARNIKTLNKKTIFNTLDDFEVVDDIGIEVRKIDGLSEYHDSIILTTLCYDYRGIAIADVCIDLDPHDTSPREKECNVKESISLSEGQGGPVVIDRIETRMLIEDDKIMPQFKIYVSNRGRGTVLQPGSISEVCSKTSLNTETYNSVRIDSIKLSDRTTGDFECIPSELMLRNEEDFVTCTLKNRPFDKAAEAFQTPLRIEISYGYMESSSKEIKIIKILPY